MGSVLANFSDNLADLRVLYTLCTELCSTRVTVFWRAEAAGALFRLLGTAGVWGTSLFSWFTSSLILLVPRWVRVRVCELSGSSAALMGLLLVDVLQTVRGISGDPISGFSGDWGFWDSDGLRSSSSPSTWNNTWFFEKIRFLGMEADGNAHLVAEKLQEKNRKENDEFDLI